MVVLHFGYICQIMHGDTLGPVLLEYRDVYHQAKLLTPIT